MTQSRMAELYSELVNYIYEDLSDLEDVRNALRGCGFTEEELREEGLLYDDDELIY